MDKVDHLGKTIFHYAAAHGFKDLIELMITRGTHPDFPDTNGNTALIFAVRRNFVDIVKMLLLQNCDVRRSCTIAGRTQHILATALRNGYKQLVKILVSAGCNCSKVYFWYCNNMVHQSIMEDEAMTARLLHQVCNPPQLLHQCRIVIRQLLTCDIHHQVDTLPLPHTLKDYLTLKELADKGMKYGWQV